MSRYLRFLPNDRVPVSDEDQGFLGVNCKVDRALLKPTLAAAAINKRFLRGAAETRPGMIAPVTLNCIGQEIETTSRMTTYMGIGLTSGKLVVNESNISTSTAWTLDNVTGTLNAQKVTTTVLGAGSASNTTGTITIEQTALATTGIGQLSYTETTTVIHDVTETTSQDYSQTDLWDVPNVHSVGTEFPYLVATSDPFVNPFPGTMTCTVTSGQDDDTYVEAFNADGTPITIPLGPYVKGLDHPQRGPMYNDLPQRYSVAIQIPQGGWIVLKSYDAATGLQGGTDQIHWAGTVTTTTVTHVPETVTTPRTFTAAQYIAAGGTLPAQCVATVDAVRTNWATYAAEDYIAGTAIPAWATTKKSVANVGSGNAETVYGAGVYSDPNGLEWLLIAVSDGVYRLRWNQGPRKIRIYDRERISQPCEIIQAFDKVIIFRASQAETAANNNGSTNRIPLVWDGDPDGLFRKAPRVATTQGFGPIPNSYTGVIVQNRLLVPTGRDQVAVSDVLDYTHYDTSLNQFRVNSGTDETITRIFPFTDSSVLVFKTDSVWQISNLTGEWRDNAVQSVLNPSIGCIARGSVATVGADVFFLSRTGVYRVLQVIAGRLQTAPVPVSDPIEPIIQRINWAVAANAQAAVSGTYYLLAVPLDGSEVNNAILRYNTVTEQWEGYDETAADLAVDRFLTTDYMGKKRLMAVDLAHKRVVVLDEGTSDLIGGVEYPISDCLETRGYTLDHPSETKRYGNAIVTLSTWNPNTTITAITDGVNESMDLLVNQTKDRARYVTFGKDDYDTSNVNGDQLAPGREDYSLVPNGVYCGPHGLVLNHSQEFIESMPLRSTGRWLALRITNTSGCCAVRTVKVLGNEMQTTKEMA